MTFLFWRCSALPSFSSSRRQHFSTPSLRWQNLFHAERLKSELSSVEALQRTFLLFGEVDFTAAHASSIKAIAQEFDQLKTAAAEEPDGTSGQVESITNIVSRRLEVLDRTAGIRRSGTFDAVLSTLRRSQGTEIMNAAKREILALETDSAARLGDQTVKRKESLRMMRWAALLTGLSGLLLLGNAVCRVYAKRA
jgi:CHASE3 domain sensor protein